MKRSALVLGLVALAAVLAACSGSSGATSAPPASAPAGGTGTTVTVVAKDLKFAPTEVSTKAGAAFTLRLDNQDSAPHNIKISDASGTEVYKGEIVTSKAVDYPIPALAAGTYPFLCEVHPDMKGTLTVQ